MVNTAFSPKGVHIGGKQAELRVAVILSIFENLSSHESVAEPKARSPDPKTSSPERGAVRREASWLCFFAKRVKRGRFAYA
jgi:hypothetical protein